MSLKKSLFHSFLGKYLSLIAQFVAGVIIARLLRPEEVGVFSVAATILALIHMFREFGINAYIIQEKNISDSYLRAAFTLNLIISWSLGGLIYTFSFYAGQFYNTPGITDVLQVTSLNFFLIPFGAISMALLQKDMQFSKLNIINVTSTIIGSLVSVICAYQGFSFMSLAWGALTQTGMSILIVQFYRYPLTLYPSFRNMSKILSYGSFSSINQVISYAGSSAPELIMGKLIDMNAVGIFGRAISLLGLIHQLIISGIKPVMLPYFANIRDSKEQLRIQYLKATDIMLGIAWPILGFLMFNAALIIEVLYGSQWLPAAPLIQIIGLGFALTLLCTDLSDELFKASGQIKTLTKITLLLSPLRFFAVLFSAPYGVINVAIAISCISLLKVIITAGFLRRIYKIKYRLYFPIVWKNMLLTGFILCFIYLINEYYPISVLLLDLVFDCFLFTLFWILGIFLLKHPIQAEIKSFFKKKTTLNISKKTTKNTAN